MRNSSIFLPLLLTLCSQQFWNCVALAQLDPGKIHQSSFSEFFAAGLAQGKIDIVEFYANPSCMNGRAKKNPGEIAAAAAGVDPAKFCGPILRGYHYKTQNPKALLLVVHGMQSNSAWFLSGEYLAQNGVEVLAFDRRGSGISEGPRGHANDYLEFINDMTGAVEFLRNKRRDIPMHLHANCFGTRIAIPYMQDYMEKATKQILQNEYLADNPNATPDDLDNQPGFKFVSVINTSPATNMSYLSEKMIRDNQDCFMQVILKDRSWAKRNQCFSKKYSDLKVLANGAAEFSDTELSCLLNFVQGDDQRLIDTACTSDTLNKLKDPLLRKNLTAADKTCLDNTAFLDDSWVQEDKCTQTQLDLMKGDGFDPNGMQMIRSPLTDDLFTTDPQFLDVIKRDDTAIRSISRSFLYAANDLSIVMNRWLKGKAFNGKIFESQFDRPVFLVLSTEDKMVINQDIVHEFFAAVRGTNLTQSSDLLDSCYSCNPKVNSKVDPAACKIDELLKCPYPQDTLECVNPNEEISGCDDGNGGVASCKDQSKPFVRCKEVRLIQPKPHQFSAGSQMQKKLLEINCEHFMELCKDRNETERYRKAMLDWLLEDRWQSDWQDFFN